MTKITSLLCASLIASALFSTGIWNDAPMYRNGLLLVEVATVTVTVREDDGELGGYDDAKGWYCGYDADTGAQMYDRVLSVFVYSPLNNCFDDVVYRHDWVLTER